jgi:hypothetical protein
LTLYPGLSTVPGKERIMTRAITPKILALALPLALTLAAPAFAQGRTCHVEIARLQAVLDKGGDIPLDTKESDFATMHRQPTPDSIAAAKGDARAKAAMALDQARQFEAQGKEADCLKALDVIALPSQR